jgi:site-specific DNA recombinase
VVRAGVLWDQGQKGQAVNTPVKSIRCALYTRKSSEEGLDQSFNSLHAQREACESYVASQRHEGWQAIATHYDDGGFSGGNMDRPGLVHLMEDIAAHRIDTVVVYKVDRLTRSLADFAKIVEAFDAQGVSFVSVTQQFNTTSSMGRLTLNILLSFAQFEREVTGERIRDKIAASKKKGMWMGGVLPLGYDHRDRQLVVNPEEAKLVKEIFTQYLRLGNVFDLKRYLDQRGLRSKVRITAIGKRHGGELFGRGALYHLLANPIYVGEISHKKQIHPGKHEAILGRKLWDEVQAKLKSNRQSLKTRTNAQSSSMLAGLLFDANGVPYTPQHSVKNGRRHRYYTSRATLRRAKEQPPITRIPATEIEKLVVDRIMSFLRSPRELSTIDGKDSNIGGLRKLINIAGLKAAQLEDAPRDELEQFVRAIVQRIVIRETEIDIQLDRGSLDLVLLGNASKGNSGESIVLRAGIESMRRGDSLRLVMDSEQTNDSVSSEAKDMARAHQWLTLVVNGECANYEDLGRSTSFHPRHVSLVLKRGTKALVSRVMPGQENGDPRMLVFLKTVTESGVPNGI